MFELRSKTKWYWPPGKWFYGPTPLPSGISWASDPPTPLEFPIPSVVGVWIFSGTTQFFVNTERCSDNFGCWLACILTQINSRILIANATIDRKIDFQWGNQALTQLQKKMRQKRIAKLKWIVDIHTGSIFFYLQSKPLHIISNHLILLWLIYAVNFSHWNCLAWVS